MKSRWIYLASVVVIAMISIVSMAAWRHSRIEVKMSKDLPHLMSISQDGTVLTSYTAWKDNVNNCLIFDVANRRFVIHGVDVSRGLLMNGYGVVVRSAMEAKVGGENRDVFFTVKNKYEKVLSEISLNIMKNGKEFCILNIVRSHFTTCPC